MYYYILYMSYPLLNYNWKDTSGNILPIANSYFAYGTLGAIPSNSSSNGLWYSLNVTSANSPSKIVEVYLNTTGNANALKFKVAGIYQITTTLKFTGYQVKTIPLSGGMVQPVTFAFSYSTNHNKGSNLNKTNNYISGPILTNNLITLSTTPYFINGSASGGSANGFATTDCGGQVAVLPTPTTTYPPFFILPNYLPSATTSNANTITAIYYIPEGQTIYFNIADTVTSYGNPSSTLDATGNYTVKLLNTIGTINTTYKPLLLNYKYQDPTNGDLPIANSTFAYGVLNQISGNIPGKAWGSLPVNSSLFDSGNNLVSVSSDGGVTFNVSGIYQLTTILNFVGTSAFTTGIKTFLFSYSTAINKVTTTTDSFSYVNNWIGGGIPYLGAKKADGSFHSSLSGDALYINGSGCGGGSDYSNGLDSNNYGGQIGLVSDNGTPNTTYPYLSTYPFFLLPNYSDGDGVTPNINTINTIYYIPAGKTIYFNIGYESDVNTYLFNAYGNYTIRLLSTIGSVNNTVPLLKYNYTDPTSINVPIANSCFAYGTLNYATNTLYGSAWGSLPIKSIDSNTGFVTKIANYIQINISGIYQITSTLTFTGITGSRTFAFSYSTQENINTSTDTITTSLNNIVGPINLYTSTDTLSNTPYFINGSSSGGGAYLNNGFDSLTYGGNICMINNTPTNTYPPFFLLPNDMQGSNTCPNLNTINAIYYIPAATKLYFNIANTDATNGLNATGNYTIELLNHLPVFVTNVNNLTVSSLQYINGYNYYTFVPTNTAGNGTASISIPKNVEMNYLLVGGGGGGGGSYYLNEVTNSKITSYCGGGGGGGQVLKSSISGSLFTLTVGNAGSAGSANSPGTKGGDTTLTYVSTSNTVIVAGTVAGGGGGGSATTTSAGGTGLGALGGKGEIFVWGGSSTNYQTATNGGSVSSVTLTEINTTYSVGGGGGGGSGGSDNGAGGRGGLNNIGGNAGGMTDGDGGNGSGYGTGGGGGGVTPDNYMMEPTYIYGDQRGGGGSTGFAVLYWKA